MNSNKNQCILTQVAHIEEILNDIGSGSGGDKEEDEGTGENWEDYETESEDENGMDHA